MNILKNSILVFFVFASISCYAQRLEIDSLQKLIAHKEVQSESYKSDSTYIDALNEIAHQYIKIHIDSTYELANKALRLSSAIDYGAGIANSLLHLGIYYSEKGKSSEALKNYCLALECAEKGNNFELIFDIRNNQGIEYHLRGEYDTALEVHLENLALANSNAPTKIPSANTNIAYLFDIQGEHLVALPYYEQALISAKQSKNNYRIGLAMSNLSHEYTQCKMYDKAREQIAKTKLFLEQHEYEFLLGEQYLYEGRLLYHTGDVKGAYKAVQTSIDYLNETNNSQINFAIRHQLMANILLKMGEHSRALEYGEKAYSIAKVSNDLRGLARASETLYMYHKDMGSTDKTLFFLEEFKKYSDSLFNNQNKNGILLLKAKSDFDKRQSELKAANDKIVLAKQNKINTSLLIIIILLSTLIPLYLKHRKLGLLNYKIMEKSKLLEKREKELVNSNNTKDRLFSIIGHDLKAPIDSLRLLLSMHQKKEVSDQEFLQFSPKLNKDIGSVSFTLTNLLNWGKTQMQGGEMEKTNFAVQPLVDEVLRFLEASGKAKNLKLINEIGAEAKAYADPNQIAIVIRNIVSNAIKFTPNRGLVQLTSKDLGNKQQISITDNGVGMDTITCKKILDPNEAYSTYGTDNEKGTGLGLLLCYELLRKNEGEIWVESKLGKGTTFHVVLKKMKREDKVLKAV